MYSNWSLACSVVMSSLKYVLDLIKGAKGAYPNGYCGFVHVEDLAAAHILAMEESKASGRYICSSSVAHWSDVLAGLRAKYPMYPFETKPFNNEGDRNQHSIDASMLLRFCSWGYKVSKVSLKCLMIASKASKTKACCHRPLSLTCYQNLEISGPR